MKKDTSYQNVKLLPNQLLPGWTRTQQVKKIEDYVFMVKGIDLSFINNKKPSADADGFLYLIFY